MAPAATPSLPPATRQCWHMGRPTVLDVLLSCLWADVTQVTSEVTMGRGWVFCLAKGSSQEGTHSGSEGSAGGSERLNQMDLSPGTLLLAVWPWASSSLPQNRTTEPLCVVECNERAGQVNEALCVVWRRGCGCLFSLQTRMEWGMILDQPNVHSM